MANRYYKRPIQYPVAFLSFKPRLPPPPPPPQYTVTFAHCTAAECVCSAVWGAVCLTYSISRYPPSDRSTGFADFDQTYEQGGVSCIGPALQQLFTRCGVSPPPPADTPPHPRMLHADHHGPFICGHKQCTPPCPNTGLSKHGDPVFLHFWFFLGTIVLAAPIQHRMCFVALCGLWEGSVWVAKCWCKFNSMCSCALGCVLACRAPFCSQEGVGLGDVCNMCSVVHATWACPNTATPCFCTFAP